jgi:anti-sigma regulatory factor (Ser/Thr protein kinase)
MPDLERKFTVKHNDFVRAGEVSIKIQGILKAIGFDPDFIRRVSVCAYESEMNVVMHGGEGTVFLTVDPKAVTLDVRDDGPGIPDIELAFQEGYSTAKPEHREMGFGAGMGLPNIKNNADTLKLDSEKGKGTRLFMDFKVA